MPSTWKTSQNSAFHTVQAASPYKRPAAVAPTDTVQDRQNKTLGGNRSTQEHETDEMKPLCQSQKGYKVTIVTNSIKLQVD